ncbi:MAG: formate C-acetyltransferase [Firmicutes bacterium]|nr:formate C-acetyltransferase [Bacillota bacterium]
MCDSRYPAWDSFARGPWCERIDVRDFIIRNYTPYEGDESFLSGPTDRTKRLWDRCSSLMSEERSRGVRDIDTKHVAGITAFGPGYIDPECEVIVGLQTDEPLKRMINPWGGWRMAEQACRAYGYEVDPSVREIFTRFRRTHNDGVYAVYTDEMRKARRHGLITGLPDTYGRGRIIGDYRRVALYGVRRLIAAKQEDLRELGSDMSEETVRLREEIFDQIQALNDLALMATSYGYDISEPARNAREAVQWLYFAYLAAAKEQNGAAMSLGRNTAFLDIYIERDIARGDLDEARAQELVDQLVIKLRMIRHLRTPEYNELFAGDPTWVTEAIGGMALDGRPLVTKTSFRFLNTLRTLGSSPEPNLTVLWSERLPDAFKRFCCTLSADTSSLQYENDDLMRPVFGDDYSISCCVSAMKTGKQMQYFGARVNLAKVLLLSLNCGRDEISGEELVPGIAPLPEGQLSYSSVMDRFRSAVEAVCRLYVDTMNCIHYMHDKYHYERLQMALHDTDVERLMAFGVAGLSVVADSLSAIRYGRVHALRDSRGLTADFINEMDFPCYGNGDDRVDSMAVEVLRMFHEALSRHRVYRQATPTLSVLTITSNVVYGKKTGATPDGRKQGQPFAPGANPMHGRETNGPLMAMKSLTRLPYEVCRDGISYTFSVVPSALGETRSDRAALLSNLIDGYMANGGHHINVNVIDRATLLDAMEHPEMYPGLTIRVSGYAVAFTKLTKEQQLEVVQRTFHGSLARPHQVPVRRREAV